MDGTSVDPRDQCGVCLGGSGTCNLDSAGSDAGKPVARGDLLDEHV